MRTSLTPRHTRLHEAHVKPGHPVSLQGEPPRAPGTAPQSAACTPSATPPCPQVSRPCSRPHPVAGDAVSPIRPPSGAPPRPGPESAVSRAPSRPRGQKPRGRSRVAIGEPRAAAWRSRVWRVSHVTCHRCTRPSPTPGPHTASRGLTRPHTAGSSARLPPVPRCGPGLTRQLAPGSSWGGGRQTPEGPPARPGDADRPRVPPPAWPGFAAAAPHRHLGAHVSRHEFCYRRHEKEKNPRDIGVHHGAGLTASTGRV